VEIANLKTSSRRKPGSLHKLRCRILSMDPGLRRDDGATCIGRY
jgi:hypothetical protein